MDVLFLLFDLKAQHKHSFQHELFQQFIHELMNFDSNKTHPRVAFADVIDTFSALDIHVNVSSWLLHSSPGSDPYGLDETQNREQQNQNLQETIELKVTFVERLFSEMGGVRENATHIGVIFLDGLGLSYEKSRNVPRIVQQQVTDIKIFLVVMSGKYMKGPVYLSDTLFLESFRPTYSYSTHVLFLAICNKCIKGWFMFEYNDITNSISCYELLYSKDPINWLQFVTTCTKENAYLSAIETKTELMFLQTKLFSYIKEFSNHSDNTRRSLNFSVQINIGLRRDVTKPHKRFHWLIHFPFSSRPLLVKKWMPGKPSGGRSNGCGVWKFIWHDHCNDNCGSENNDRFVNGWVDVDCADRLLSFTLCEITLLVRTNNINMLEIKLANNGSFSRALTKGDFVSFKENIVSITTNIVNQEFIPFLKQSGIEFPLFDCGIGEEHPRYISYMYVCDNTDNCRNKRDEAFCSIPNQVAGMTGNEQELHCKGFYCCDGSCLPWDWVIDGEIDCFVCGYGTQNEVHDESEIVIYNHGRNETCAFFCNQNECISLVQLNDGHVDCHGPEGPLDETIGKLPTADTCYNTLGFGIWAPRCVYFEDVYGAVIGCRDMSHLNNCTDFECPEGYFKCPNTYCIPQHYVLDGKSDCPTGEFEQRDIISPCSGNFACWNSQICLHPDLVCNGHSECPYQDDEIDCSDPCPDGFRCVSGTITILDYNKAISLKMELFKNKQIKYIDLSGLEMLQTDIFTLYIFYSVLICVLSNCKITNSSVKHLSLFSMVRYLDLSHNMITTLDELTTMDGSFIDYFPLENVRHLNLSYNRKLVFKYFQMTYLETLDLSHTGLTDIDMSFTWLPNLKHFNLSFTFVTEIRKNLLHSGLILRTLDLRGLTMAYVYTDMFNGLTISQDLYTDSFELCCPQIRGTNIPYYKCHSPEEAISSCFNLIGVNVQRVLLWTMAMFAVLGNMTVIGYRLIWDRSSLRTGYGLFVTNLGISDFIMGTFLFIIAVSDYHYRDNYVLYDKIWRESVACSTAGFLATLSSETSILFIFLITLDRFLVMKFPFGQIKFIKVSKLIAVLLSWSIGILFATSPIVFSFEIYSSNAMCIALPLTTKRLKGWEFSFGVFIIFNIFMCLFITCGQRAIFRAMSENRISATMSSSSRRRAEKITVAKQLFLVALSNFLSWFPIALMGLIAFSEHEINKHVYSWTTVLVLPISSAANPILYTIPVLMERFDRFRNGKV